MSTAIEFNNISKQYRLGLVSTQTLSHDLNRWWKTAILRQEDPYLKIGETNDRATKGNSDYVWALRDIDFKVEQGDVLGIIGKNGAGKSTLLKILSKVTSPTTGTIKARGRIASLLEVGTGFHPEMTGRENIYLNGAIMGMTKAEIARKLDEIVDFSGVERYLDTPVKRYSSGMTVRLGFAIAAHLEPEILVVDEVLAVGDAEFQKKAIGKMQDVSKGEGRTVLFVSHNMTAVMNLCKTGVLLENGSVSFSGNIDDVVDRYLSDYNENPFEDIENDKRREGSGDVIFTGFNVLKMSGDNTTTIMTGEDIIFNFIVKAQEEKKIDLGFSIHNMDGSTISILYSGYQNHLINVKSGYNLITCLIKDFSFSSPTIRISGLIKSPDGTIYDWPKLGLGVIDVVKGDYYRTGKESHVGAQCLIRGEWKSKLLEK